MYINAISCFLPSQKVSNDYFTKLNGLSDEWIRERTGIRERRKAVKDENTNSMGVAAAEKGIKHLPYDARKINMIVGATYTPHDTIVTLGHAVQHALDLPDIVVTSLSSACSSFINAMEVVQGYFALNKADHALVVVSEHNTAYNNEHDTVAGHLWGDGAAAVFVSRERYSDQDIAVKDILSAGAATSGRATEGVMLKPVKEGISMPYGKDVFINACNYMPKATRTILERNQLSVGDLTYLVPHQANYRITKRVAKQLEMDGSKALSNVQYLGNTGCAGCAIALGEHWDEFKPGDNIVVTVFGGGYSYGAMLLQH